MIRQGICLLMSERVQKRKNYKKPPIIEAVIEVRFAHRLEDRALEKLVSKQKESFLIERLEDLEVKFSPQESAGVLADTRMKFAGYKLTSIKDASIIVQVKPDAVSVSLLPPYEGKGWETLAEHFNKYYDWYTSKKYRKLSRIGVRYINRIDIPCENGKIKLEDYIRIYPESPKRNFPDYNKFYVQIVSKLESERELIVNIGGVGDIYLLDHLSIFFDLDVSQSQNLPEKSSLLFETLDDIRDQKDFFFESLLTAKCKRLFER